MHWCSNYKQFQPKEVTWAAGEPSNKGSCVYMKSNNASSLAAEDCSKEMRYLCDVRKKGTDGMAMQQECMETWGVTPSERRRDCVIALFIFYILEIEELNLVTNTSVDITSLGLNVKVKVNQFVVEISLMKNFSAL
jgi:hypothetical protein